MLSLIKLALLFTSVTGLFYLLIGDNLYKYAMTFLDSEFFGIVISFLFAIDIFLIIPTLPLSLLAGYKLGFVEASFFISLGLLSAGVIGYVLGYVFGDKILNFILRDKTSYFSKIFKENSTSLIILSRALPMLPEACALLSGSLKIPLKKFLTAWLINTIPYAVFTSYMGYLSYNESKVFIGIAVVLFYTLSFFISRYIKKMPR